MQQAVFYAIFPHKPIFFYLPWRKEWSRVCPPEWSQLPPYIPPSTYTPWSRSPFAIRDAVGNHCPELPTWSAPETCDTIGKYSYKYASKARRAKKGKKEKVVQFNSPFNITILPCTFLPTHHRKPLDISKPHHRAVPPYHIPYQDIILISHFTLLILHSTYKKNFFLYKFAAE